MLLFSHGFVPPDAVVNHDPLALWKNISTAQKPNAVGRHNFEATTFNVKYVSLYDSLNSTFVLFLIRCEML